MQVIGSRFLVVLITFGIGVACARLTNLFSQPTITIEHHTVTTTEVIRTTPKFKLVGESCESGCVETYETPNGEQVSFTYACFTATAPDALRAMEQFINEGIVLEQQQEVERQGATQRTVVRYAKDDTGASPVKIFSYHHGDVCFQYIEAGSLELALEFERSGIPAEFFTRYSE